MELVYWDSRRDTIKLRTRERDEDEFDEFNLIFANRATLASAKEYAGQVAIPAVRKQVTDGTTPAYSMGPFLVSRQKAKDWPTKDDWLEAYVRLSDRTFAPILEGDDNPRPKIAFWHQGGFAPYRGLRRPSDHSLERAILKLYDEWQTAEFAEFQRSKNFTLWGARLQSLQDSGFKQNLKEQRLKKAYYFLFPTVT